MDMEQLTVQPIKTFQGEIELPGSKSISNRILLLAALSQGTTVVDNLLQSEVSETTTRQHHGHGPRGKACVHLSVRVSARPGRIASPSPSLLQRHARTHAHTQDIAYMLQALKTLGVDLKETGPKQWTVPGRGAAFDTDQPVELFLGNAGTAMRPLTAALCAGKGQVRPGGQRRDDTMRFDRWNALMHTPCPR